MLAIYYGPDSYSRAEAIAALKAELDTDGMLSVNSVTFDGAHLNPAELTAACDTIPFLSAHRLVTLTDYLTQAQGRQSRARPARRRGREDPAAPAEDFLIEYVPRMPPTTTLLLVDGAVRDDHPLLLALKPMADIRRYPLLSEQQVVAWIATRSRARRVTVEPRAAQLLAQAVRSDLWALSTELEKLSLYANGRPIGEADVRAMVPATHESNVFSMVDAVVAGRLEPAILQLHLLLQDGAAGPYLIAMIARQYRQLIIAQDMLAAGAATATIAQKTEIRSEAALRRVLQQARRAGAEQLERCYQRILDADLSIKRGEAEESVALELLVMDLAAGRTIDS